MPHDVVHEDVAEDEVSYQVVELHLRISHNQNHPYSVPQQQEVNSTEEALHPIVHLSPQAEGGSIEEQVNGGIGVDGEEDGSIGAEIVGVQFVEGWQEEGVDEVKEGNDEQGNEEVSQGTALLLGVYQYDHCSEDHIEGVEEIVAVEAESEDSQQDVQSKQHQNQGHYCPNAQATPLLPTHHLVSEHHQRQFPQQPRVDQTHGHSHGRVGAIAESIEHGSGVCVCGSVSVARYLEDVAVVVGGLCAHSQVVDGPHADVNGHSQDEDAEVEEVVGLGRSVVPIICLSSFLLVSLGVGVGRLGGISGRIALHLDGSWVAALGVHFQLYNEWEFVSPSNKIPTHTTTLHPEPFPNQFLHLPLLLSFIDGSLAFEQGF